MRLIPKGGLDNCINSDHMYVCISISLISLLFMLFLSSYLIGVKISYEVSNVKKRLNSTNIADFATTIGCI